MSEIRQERTGWRADAACAAYPADWWFPENKEDRNAARAICKTCPVLAECLAEVLAGPPQRGIRAGLTPYQIRRIKELRAA